MSKRRGNGEGSISQRNDGYWIGQITLGFDPRTCKQIRKTVSAKTQKECREKIDKLKQARNQNTLVKTNKQPLSNWLNEWLDTYKKRSLKQKTYDNYLRMIERHIGPNLGKITLQKINTLQIQQFINRMIDDDVAPASIRYAFCVLSASFNQAVKLKLLSCNPCESVVLPKLQRSKIQTFTAEQIKHFLSVAEHYYLYPAFLLQATCGLRKGEVLGLRWENVNLDNGYITINQQLVDSSTSGIWIDSPKTENSVREVPLPPEVIEILKRYKKESGWVATNKKGGYIQPRNYNRSFDILLKRAGLPHIKLHALRHSFATLMVANGVDLKSVSQIIGHSSVAFTAQVYTHPNMETKQQAMSKVGNLLLK